MKYRNNNDRKSSVARSSSKSGSRPSSKLESNTIKSQKVKKSSRLSSTFSPSGSSSSSAEKRIQKRRDAQKARVLSNSLNHKSENDFNAGKSMFGRLDSGIKKILIIGSIIFVVLGIGIAVGIAAFFASTSSKLFVGDEVKARLANTPENQPYYTLFAADTDGDSANKPDLLMLTRIDPSDKSFIFVNIPMQTYVISNNGGATSIEKIYDQEGDAGLVSVVCTFAEIGITHFVRTTDKGLYGLIDSLGGIEVNLKEYLDDATVGDVYIPQGVSTIDGYMARALLNSKNFNGGSYTVSLNTRQVCIGLLNAAITKNKSDCAVIVDMFAGEFKSDMGVSDILSFVDFYNNKKDIKILDTEVPGYKTVRNNNMVYMIDSASWKKLRAQMDQGSLPSTDDDITINDIDASSFSILIQNGAGIDGAGAMLSGKLTNLGFKVSGTENADTNVYQETLIIYNGDDFEKDAYAVRNTINNGRIVDGQGLYNMKSEIMIIIGADLKV